MRLINIDTLRLEEFSEGNIPPYFILSHTWGEDEISFQEYLWLRNHIEEAEDGVIDELPAKQQERLHAKSRSLQLRRGYSKIWNFARLSRRLRKGDWALGDRASPDDTAPWPEVNYIWVDTCCINKESSAELSEAINSMYKWYGNAHLCIAHLSDIGVTAADRDSDFGKSRWFTRGWTLQELLAPDLLFFYDKNWSFIAQRSTAADAIQAVTKIGHRFLTRKYPIEKVCLAERMSWAAGRKTTRLEDEAYCLMGIFNVNMPLLYGEGRKAFQRLQQEIIRCSKDQSVFAWGLRYPLTSKCDFNSMLAPSPSSFAHCTSLSRRRPQESVGNVDLWSSVLAAPYQMTNLGLAITVNLFRLSFGTSGLTRTYAALPITLDINYPLCIPLTSVGLEKTPLEDLPDGTVLVRPMCEAPISIFRIPTLGKVKLVRKSIIIDNDSPEDQLPLSPPIPQFRLTLDLSSELSFIEMWSSSLTPTSIGRSHLVHSEPLCITFKGSEQIHYRAWHPVFFLIRREIAHAGTAEEYLVAISLDRESQTVQWVRVFDWEAVRRRKGVFAPSMAALFLAAPDLARHAAWPADLAARGGIRIQYQVEDQEQNRERLFRFGLEYAGPLYELRQGSVGQLGCGNTWFRRETCPLARSKTFC